MAPHNNVHPRKKKKKKKSKLVQQDRRSHAFVCLYPNCQCHVFDFNSSLLARGSKHPKAENKRPHPWRLICRDFRQTLDRSPLRLNRPHGQCGVPVQRWILDSRKLPERWAGMDFSIQISKWGSLLCVVSHWRCLLPSLLMSPRPIVTVAGYQVTGVFVWGCSDEAISTKHKQQKKEIKT